MKFGKTNGSVVIWDDHNIKQYPTFDSILPFITDNLLAKTATSNEITDPVKLQLPYVPSKIICLAKNYSAHAVEMGVSPEKLPKFPSLFLKPPSSVIGPGENIIIPPQTKEVHHEVELGVIIGKPGKNIPIERSFDHVFGYTILLDITARDIQSQAKKNGRPWFVAKGFDTFCPIGPVVVTTDAISDPQDLNLQLMVNEEVRQQGSTKDMIFKVDQIISYCSSIVSLEAGDIIATGTPEGVAAFSKGDRIIASIDNIGTLEIGVE
jgi:2-keto-4-pentenoate hydratase/2-oxohepta-3-ene-1,7-dioic acid hydratase in catechol pathway